MKKALLLAVLALTLVFVGVVSAELCTSPWHWGPWSHFIKYHPNQTTSHQLAWDAAYQWCEGYICDYYDVGCQIVWQGSMMVWMCEVDARRCIYP